jgi:signal transduction histidine kinase
VEPSPDTRRWAELIASARAQLIERWTRWVIEDPSIPEANRLSRPELVDHLPRLIDNIVAELEAREAGESSAQRVRRSQRVLDAATEHGRNRAGAGYDLRSAMRELGLFRTILIEVCAERGLPLMGVAATAVHRVIDTAFAEAAMTMEEAFTADLAAERDRAQQADADKEEFLTFLSHEARNVLNIILGWSRLADGADEAVLRKALAIIDRNGRLLSRLVTDIVDYRRAEMGKLQLDPRPIAVCDVVRAACEAARPTAGARHLAISLPACPEGIVIVADVDRMAQVLGNLLDNAIKFTGEGGRVEVSVDAREQDVVIAVRDDGIGIAPELVEHVFDPYRQGEGRTDKGGLGIGLALVRELVERQGGSVRCESPGLGKGATFSVTFPRHRAGDADAAGTAP